MSMSTYEDEAMEQVEPYWMDDLFQYNLSEADDYRDEMDESDYYEDRSDDGGED